MTPDALITVAEQELRTLSRELTEPHPGECLLCYVYRMLEHGCTGLRWAARYRDLKAPKVAGLERRLGEVGGYCDCEIFLNGFEPARELWTPGREHDDEDGGTVYVESDWPEQLPDCRGARAGSTKGCSIWVRQRRRW
jgi:hypothetical protein